MAITDIYVRNRQRDYLNITLESSGSAIDLSAYDHVSLVVRDSIGTVTEYSSADGSPIIFLSDPSNGVVSIHPSATFLLSARSPYYCYWKGYVDSTRWYSIPSEDPYFRIFIHESFQ